MLENDLKKLEDLVKKMEAGNLPLEESLKAFEEGMTLVKSCQKTLADAELKVKEVIEKSRGEFAQTELKGESSK